MLIDYIDANFELQQATHVLGSTGTDTTSFSGLGINQMVVVSSGTSDSNVNTITASDTSAVAGTQSVIPPGDSVSQQILYHIPINHIGVLKYLSFSTNKLSGANPKVLFKVVVYNRFVDTKYTVRRYVVDTQSQTSVNENNPIGISLSGRDVIYVTMDTDQNSTEAQGDISLNVYQTV